MKANIQDTRTRTSRCMKSSGIHSLSVDLLVMKADLDPTPCPRSGRSERHRLSVNKASSGVAWPVGKLISEVPVHISLIPEVQTQHQIHSKAVLCRTSVEKGLREHGSCGGERDSRSHKSDRPFSTRNANRVAFRSEVESQVLPSRRQAGRVGRQYLRRPAPALRVLTKTMQALRSRYRYPLTQKRRAKDRYSRPEDLGCGSQYHMVEGLIPL